MTGKWYKDLFKKENRLPTRIYLYILITLLPSIILLTFIHEFGHYIIATLLGWNVSCLKLNLLPFVLDLESAFICLSPDAETTSFEWVLVAMGGSLHTLIWGYIFFILFYKFELPPILEIFFFLYSFMLVLEITFYLITDIFILKFGDWYIVYMKASYLIPIFLIISFLNLYFFLKNFWRLSDRLEIS